MLLIKVDRVGERVFMDAINRHPDAAFRAVGRGMRRTGRGIHNAAARWLAGSRDNTGGFPVPTVTGHLARSLNWLAPGETKAAGGQSVRAGPMETVVYNTARYADVVARGTHSSAKFGARDFLRAGLDDFNAGNRIAVILDEELSREWPGA